MGAVSFQIVRKTLAPERRWNWRWYPWRNYWHAAWHQCITARADRRNRFLWIALGPIDLRVHVTEKQRAD